WDAHNLDVKGENTLLVANYTMGVRLVDTTDKTSPTETAFYLPNANKSLACNQHCYFQGRETWGAYFGSDGNIYASDFWLGFFIINPNCRAGTSRRRSAGSPVRQGVATHRRVAGSQPPGWATACSTTGALPATARRRCQRPPPVRPAALSRPGAGLRA